MAKQPGLPPALVSCACAFVIAIAAARWARRTAAACISLAPSRCPAQCRHSANPAPAAAGATLVSIVVGVPLIKRKVQRDWEELSRPDAIPELEGVVQATPGGAKVSQGLGGPGCRGSKVRVAQQLQLAPTPACVPYQLRPVQLQHRKHSSCLQCRWQTLPAVPAPTCPLPA